MNPGPARILSLVVLAAACSCNIFDTRDPESPSSTTSTFEPPVTPETVLKNLRGAIGENNPDNYIRCFIDTTLRPYVFVPSSDIRPNFPEWSLNDENRYFRSMGSRLDGRPVLTDSVQNGVFYSDSTYTIRYSLFFPHRDPQAPRFVQGSMLLHLGVDPQGRWAIDRWEDIRIPQLPDSTWSYLKFWFNR
ncbi:MAG TPA: hypothetical protein VI932_08270 [Bacteroidota bacterium]|nr:hypothetical protein [Bacteroidota bacterium]